MIKLSQMRLSDFVWLDENQFTATHTRTQRFSTDAGKTYQDVTKKIAVYGWSKGGSFFVYMVREGHIQKWGTVKRLELEAAHPPVVQ